MSEIASWHREFKHGDDRIWHRCPGCGRPIPGQGPSLQLSTVPRVLVDLGAGHSPPAVRESADAEARRDVLGHRAGRGPLPVGSSLVFAFAQYKMLWTDRLPRRPGGCAERSITREPLVERASSSREAACRPCDGLQGDDRCAGLGEAEAWACAHARRPLGLDAGGACVGGGLRNALADLAPSKGFGFVDGWEKIRDKIKPGVEAAAYLSGYFVKGKGRKASLTENVQDPDLPRLLVFIGRGLTAETGCTMRNLRLARRLWASRQGLTEPPRLEYREWLAAGHLLARRRE